MCEPKEWTLMFYFATDNPLAISAVSQLKAIKDAGFHHDANVVAQFDPYTEGTPTHVFDVNVVNKLKSPDKSNIGFSGIDPTVRSLVEDKLWRDEQTSSTPAGVAPTPSNRELVRSALNKVLKDQFKIDYKPPVAPNVNSIFNPRTDRMEEPGAKTSLQEFLRFCADKYPAKHYMLFMLGHGVVVGNDVFMLDEHASSEQSLTLTDLADLLGEFKHSIELEGSTFDLVSFHSCSVSSLEVAYELRGTAKYMLASQGPAFVGSWPYRQILIRIFNALEDKSLKVDGPQRDPIVRDLMFEIYHSCMRNSADYLLAGYSFQLTLCDLDRVQGLQKQISELARALTVGLQQDLARDYILLSHWKSQSFFNEMYTDLYDFCFCLTNKIDDLGEVRVSQALQDIRAACTEVMNLMVKENPKKKDHPDLKQIIVAADSLGPAFQYSRGFSVYFPWQEPSRDSAILAQYQRYRFTTEIEHPWFGFLSEYFRTTKRTVSSDEPDKRRFLPHLPTNGKVPIDQGLDEDIASLIYSGQGTPDLSAALALLPGGVKSDPTDKTGGDYEVISIKNFPRDTRSRNQRMQQADVRFPIFEAFGLFDRATNGQSTNGASTNGASTNGQPKTTAVTTVNKT